MQRLWSCVHSFKHNDLNVDSSQKHAALKVAIEFPFENIEQIASLNLMVRIHVSI
jgi:hypothetical protein